MFRDNITEYWGDSTVGMAFVLHAANLDLIPSTPTDIPSALPGEMLEHKPRSKLWAAVKCVPKI